MGTFIWHELVTTDVKGSLSFYKHVMGWTVTDMPSERLGTYHVVEASGKGLGGVMSMPGMSPHWVGYIYSSDVDRDAKRIEQAGGKIHRPPEDIPTVGRFAPVSDPQGAGFVLFKPTPPPGKAPELASGLGAVGWNELHTTDWKAAFAFYSELFGWKKGQAMDMKEAGIYQLFSAGGPDIGGMMNRMSPAIPPQWTYYFNVDAVTPALGRVKEKGGTVLMGSTEVPGPMWTAQCKDPQGASFALVGMKP